MKDFVDQHIVPRCYLNRFADNSNGSCLIGTRYVNKNNEVKLFKSSTANVGYIKNYYDVSDQADTKYWEHYFAETVDSLCGLFLGNFISSVCLAGEGFSLSKEDKHNLSRIIVAQALRVPVSFDFVSENIYPRVLAQVKKNIYKKIPTAILESHRKIVDDYQMSAINQREVYLNCFFDDKAFNYFVNALSNRIWVVYLNAISSNVPFVTSDNPVLIENLDDRNRKGLFKNGITNSGTCIFFPLSPNVAVGNYSDKRVPSTVRSRIDGKVFILDEIDYICSRNLQIIKQAHKHSFIPEPLFGSLLNYRNII